jgi:spore protease
VMAQTGMETGEIVEGIVKKIHPDALIVIDALAAKSSERLNRTIQISNTGIAPGSGVGNQRNEITEKTMGVPVIALGVPTVISIPSLACDIMDSFCASQGEKMEDTFSSWPESEKYRFLGEILDAKLWELFVTPKEIDEAVKRISYTLSEGINQFVSSRTS